VDREVAQDRVLDAAEELFYSRGIQTVGMDDIRGLSGVSLKRLYQLFGTKDQLVEAYLERRDLRWRQCLSDHVEACGDPEGRIIAVFDWLEQWFNEPGFRGCAWINSYGELGTTSTTIATHARRHKQAFKRYLEKLTTDARLPHDLAGHLLLLAEGAMVTAGIFGTPGTAAQARVAAGLLLESVRQAQPPLPAR
jgi:AcrR family transcriptional regulator